MIVWTATQAPAPRLAQAREAASTLTYHYARAIRSLTAYALGRVSMA